MNAAPAVPLMPAFMRAAEKRRERLVQLLILAARMAFIISTRACRSHERFLPCVDLLARRVRTVSREFESGRRSFVRDPALV